MLDAVCVSKSFGPQVLLREASFKLTPGDHLSLIGPNGSGKTTILRMLAGEEPPDGGEIQRRRGLTVGYLSQEVDVSSEAPLLSFVQDVAEQVRGAEAELREIEGLLARGDERPELLERYGHLQARFEYLGGYRLKADAERVLAGLGFEERAFGRPLSTFSGGWRMRAALARLLVRRPELLLLDEPTNHLDIVTLEWLEGFLREDEGAFLVVSHDVAFLDRVTAGGLAIEGGRLFRWKGSYSSYAEGRADREEKARAAAENDARRRAETQAFIDRFRSKATKAKQVQSRLRRLEKEEAPEAPPPAPRALALVLPQPARSGRLVAALEGVEAGYGGVPVYRNLSFRVERGEKVALIGPNGAGKTTLLKILAGELAPLGGTVEYGAGVSLSYFAQHQLEQLDPRRTALEEMRALPGLRSELELRRMLGAFLFSGEAVDKPIEVLSGGEKSRLVLAKLFAQPGNFFLLDEPTNHLDLQACSVLKQALAGFEGTLCLITHDRDLINHVATRVVYVDRGEVRSYLGNYDDFALKRAAEAEAAACAEPPGVPEAGRSGRKEQRRTDAERRNRFRRETAALRARVEELEGQISAAEARLATVEAGLADPATYADGRLAAGLSREQGALTRSVEELTGAWEAAASALEEAERRFAGEG